MKTTTTTKQTNNKREKQNKQTTTIQAKPALKTTVYITGGDAIRQLL